MAENKSGWGSNEANELIERLSMESLTAGITQSYHDALRERVDKLRRYTQIALHVKGAIQAELPILPMYNLIGMKMLDLAKFDPDNGKYLLFSNVHLIHLEGDEGIALKEHLFTSEHRHILLNQVVDLQDNGLFPNGSFG